MPPPTRAVRAVVLAALVAALAFVAVPAPTARAASGCDWPTYGREVGRSFAAAPGCSSLTRLTAPTLVPDWVYPTKEPVSASTTVVDDTVYVGDWGGTFYALPAHNSLLSIPKPRWTFQVDDTDGVAFGRITSTAAVATVAGRRVVVFGGGATLYALDAANGALLAKACLDPRSDPALRCRSAEGEIEIESSPAVLPAADGASAQVLVGMDVHNNPNVGRTGLVSLALSGGESGFSLTPQWKFDPESAAAYTGPGLLTTGAGTGLGCGGVWASPTVDVAAGLVFFGTSSCSFDGVTAGESVWAVALADGSRRWQYLPPRESTRFDDDFGATANLLPGGLVGAASKDGWYYALDEQTGALAWRTHVAQSGHLQEDFSIGGIIGTPAVGAVRGQPAIFVTSAIATPLDDPLPSFTLDRTLLTQPGRLLSLSAIRASDGALLWRNLIARQSYGAPSYANGVVLVPSTFSFQMDSVDADTGRTLSVLPVLGPPAASPTPVGDTVYLGVGTSETDLEFKAFRASALEPYLGSSPLSLLSGVYAFRPALRAAAGLVPGG